MTVVQSNHGSSANDGDGMKVLVIDVGGTNVKMLASGHETPRRFPSGKRMMPLDMVSNVLGMTQDWEYEVVAIGYPGPVLRGQPVSEPANLAEGWMGFDFAAAFHCPVKVVNDAAMQALGSYEGGKMLFVGLGTGLGFAAILDGELEAMELGHCRYKKRTLEDYVGARGLERLGRKKWQRHVERFIARLAAALHPDDIVIGGGNAKKLRSLPPGTRAGDNAKAFVGGFRLWEGMQYEMPSPIPPPRALATALVADGEADPRTPD